MEPLRIEYVPVDSIKPYEKNAKLHPQEQVEQIKRSIRDNGMNDPIGVWHDTVVEGHGRLLACKELGMTEVPVIRLDHMTDEQRREYMLIHNQTTMNSGWDAEILNAELGDLVDFDAGFYGFDIPENEEVVEDNYEPVVPEEPRAKIGDVYELGRHRLMCGDSTVESNVLQLVDGMAIDMLLTDPPYNVDYEGAAGKLKNDNMESTEFRRFLTKAFRLAGAVMKRGAPFHIWHAETEGYNFRGSCMDAGFHVRQQLIWVKSSPTLGRQDFQRQYESVLTGDTFLTEEEEERGYEPALYGWKEGAAHRWYKKRKERDVLFFDKPVASKEHPTMKPVLLFDYEMKCNTKPGDCVLDLFAGSGTTIMAAEQNGRTAFCMEYDPRFVDVIIDRWEKFTGRKAVLLNGERRESESSNLG